VDAAGTRWCRYPPDADACLEQATGVLVTTSNRTTWTRGRGMDQGACLPVWASGVDVPSLRGRGLDAHALRDGMLGWRSSWSGPAWSRGDRLADGTGLRYYLAHPDEPSVYLTSDAVLTDGVLDAVARLQPDLVIAPGVRPTSGGRRHPLLARRARHPGAARASRRAPEPPRSARPLPDHARGAVHAHGARSPGARVHILETASSCSSSAVAGLRIPAQRQPAAKPGFQQWLTSKFA